MKTTTFIKTGLILAILLLGLDAMAQPNLSLSNVNTQATNIWTPLQVLLLSILGIGGAIGFTYIGIIYFTGGNTEQNKKVLLGSVVALIMFAVVAAL